jgi:parvulin-like peptidyl-prolyl isomerase
MYRAISRIVVSILVALAVSFPAGCFAGSGKRLMTINGLEYTNDDFKHWWMHWNDKNALKFPATPEDFIAFQIMVQQGIEMGYDTQPNYLHKLDVFLQVRTMMALKYEEVDSKAVVTEADLKKYFDENYSTVWVLQALAFDSESKAQKAYEVMLPLKGQASGQLIFADLLGGSAEEKADTYDEVKPSVADFHKNKKDAWLSIVRKLEPGEVSKPFLNADSNKYVLLRLVKIQSAEAGVFEEKRQKMTEILNKEKRNQLTSILIENLKKKYKVEVDRELLNSIKLDVEYPNEFLERKLIKMSDFNVTVKIFIYNTIKEKTLRKGVSDELLKELVLNSIISQTLINKESLARGYEKRPPMLWTYEFYKQSRLKAEVEAGLLHDIVVTDQDIKNYYDLNIAAFTVQGKVTFSLLKADEDVLKKIWIGTLSGGDFTELAKRYSLDANIQSQDLVSLSPEILAELKKLDKGSVSLPFVFDGNFGMLKLYERLPGQVSSLEQVKGQISEQLKKEKFEVIKAEYLNKLKSRSKIDINEGVWNDLERELGNGKKD